MKIIYLPGFSARNKEAAAELKSEFKKEGFELNVIYWYFMYINVIIYTKIKCCTLANKLIWAEH